MVGGVWGWGVWGVVSGVCVWCVVCGVWCVVYGGGVWCVVCGGGDGQASNSESMNVSLGPCTCTYKCTYTYAL